MFCRDRQVDSIIVWLEKQKGLSQVPCFRNWKELMRLIEKERNTEQKQLENKYLKQVTKVELLIIKANSGTIVCNEKILAWHMNQPLKRKFYSIIYKWYFEINCHCSLCKMLLLLLTSRICYWLISEFTYIDYWMVLLIYKGGLLWRNLKYVKIYFLKFLSHFKVFVTYFFLLNKQKLLLLTIRCISRNIRIG